jgi:general secretion pathway protein G
MISQYTQDRKKAPQSLDDLKTAGYLQTIPDDITGSNTWETEPADGVIMSLEQKDADGIIGVHSGSTQVGSNGTAYSTW